MINNINILGGLIFLSMIAAIPNYAWDLKQGGTMMLSGSNLMAEKILVNSSTGSDKAMLSSRQLKPMKFAAAHHEEIIPLREYATAHPMHFMHEIPATPLGL